MVLFMSLNNVKNNDLTLELLEKILAQIPLLNIGIIGDSGLDIYWTADMLQSELSREAPFYTLPIIEERFSLGAGTNVAANLMALGAKNIHYIGIQGKDWRASLLNRLLEEIGVSTKYFVSSPELMTMAHCKTMRKGYADDLTEDARKDFVNSEPISRKIEDQLLEHLETVCQAVDVLIVVDQYFYGCVTPRIVERINALGDTLPIIVDSRANISLFQNVIVKPNEVEASAALGKTVSLLRQAKDFFSVARTLETNTGKPVFVTLGDKGAILCEEQVCSHVEAYPVPPPTDFVGAGDAFLAGAALGVAMELPYLMAIRFASLVSSITIQKLGITGTATPKEMTAALAEYSSQNATLKEVTTHALD